MADALHAAATDVALRERLIANGRRRGREFSWEKTAQATLEMCREAAAIRAGARPRVRAGSVVPDERTTRL
jgi:hypothetical protein